MATGKQTPTTFMAEYAALEQRVYGMETSLKDFASATRNEFQSMRHEAQQANSILLNQIQTLQNAVTERAKPQYGLLVSIGTLIVAVLGLIGTLAKSPIEQGLVRLESRIETMDKDMVPRAELLERWRAAERTQDRFEKRIDSIEALTRQKTTLK